MPLIARSYGLIAVFLIVMVCVIPCTAVLAKQSILWIMTYSSTGNDFFHSLTPSDDGGYVLAGYTNSTMSGRFNAWLTKINSSGLMEWNQTYGGLRNDVLHSVVAASDGGYAFAGGTISFGNGSTDVWLVKVDSLGNIEWNKTYGGSERDMCYSLVTTSDGGYVLLCQTDSFGAGGTDVWLVKVDSLGNMEWNQTYGGPGIEFLNSIVATYDGGYALAGSTSLPDYATTDVWLVKVDSLGNMEWNQTYGGELADYCDAMVVSKYGYTLACITQPQPPLVGDGSVWLARMDFSGILLWNQTYGISAYHSQTSLLITDDGNYILGCSTRNSDGLRDFWLAKIQIAEVTPELNDYLQFCLFLLILLVVAVVATLLYRKLNRP